MLPQQFFRSQMQTALGLPHASAECPQPLHLDHLKKVLWRLQEKSILCLLPLAENQDFVGRNWRRLVIIDFPTSLLLGLTSIAA